HHLGRPRAPRSGRHPARRVRGHRGRRRGSRARRHRGPMSGALLRASSLAAVLVATVALAGAEIHIRDANDSGQGLNDRTPADPVGGNPGTTVGEQRLIAAQYAAALWSATLGNRVPITIRTEFVDLDCSGGTAVLGASGPSALYDDNRYPAALANERAGHD